MTVARELVGVLGASALMLLGTSNSPILIWNATASAPAGLYALFDDRDVRRGDLVLAYPPRVVQIFAARRGYLPLGVPLVKHVAALGGDRVCADTGGVRINGLRAVVRLQADSAGRALPAWRGCRVLAANEVLLLNATVTHSFDGRYFGPISTTSILGKLVPLWIH